MEKRFVLLDLHDIVNDLTYAIQYANIPQADKDLLNASELILNAFCYMLNSGLEGAQLIRQGILETTSQATLDMLEFAACNAHDQLVEPYHRIWDTVDCEEDIHEIAYKPDTFEVMVTIKVSLALQRHLDKEKHDNQIFDPFVDEFKY